MNKNFKDLVLHFYNEALKHEVNTASFLESSKHVTLLYRDNFGMSQIWLDYHKALTDNDKNTAEYLFNMMFSKLQDL